jgi:hypothetical protein
MFQFNKEPLLKRLVSAKELSKTFKVPQLPAPQPKLFTQAWLETICMNRYTAKAMLASKLPAEIDKKVLQKWLQTHTECQPYLDLLPK